MIRSAKEYPLSQIFPIESKIIYHIPKYQREYVWSKTHWQYLIDDISENDNGYFIGSIICINKGTDALSIAPLEVVDGQQRLTTISLLMLAVYRKMRELDLKDNEDFTTDLTNLKRRLLIKHDNQNYTRVEPSFQNNNYYDFKAIYKDNNLLTGISVPSYRGVRRIEKAYQFFYDYIKDYDYDSLKTIIEKINSAMLVKIEVESHSAAFILFETINNRGIPLSAIDLIKNQLLSELEKEKVLSIDEAFNGWKDIIDNIPDYTNQDRFLRQYYNCFQYNSDVKVKSLSKATRSNLIEIYQELVKRKPELIYRELIRASEIYHKFIDPMDTKNSTIFNKHLKNLIHIGSAPGHTFLLYLFYNYSKDEDLILKILILFEKYFVRRNLTDYPPTRDLDSIFIELIQECESNKNKFSYSVVEQFLTHKTRYSTDDVFKEKLNGDIYSDNPGIARYILCKIEELEQTKETMTDLWAYDENVRYIWTIEHVLPEGNNIPKDWINMIGDGDKEKAMETFNDWVHKLGNLTVTGYNSKLSNMSFERKRDRTDNKGNFVGYKNGLKLNEIISKLEKWTVVEIKERHQVLVENAFKIFSI